MEEIYIVEPEEEKETVSNLNVASSSEQNVKNPEKKSPYAAVIVEKVDNLLPCNQCSRSFKLADSLIRHINIMHNRETCGPALNKKFKCQKCSITFGRFSFLEVHRSRIHQGEVFNDDYEEWDKDTHKAFGPTTDKNFRCYKCSISFGRKDYLEIHKARVHNEIRIAPTSIITSSGSITTTFTPIKMSNNPVSVKGPSIIMTKGQIFPTTNKNPHPSRRNIDSLRFGSTTTVAASSSSSTISKKSTKPFECTQCKASFSKKTMLNLHVKTIHEGHKLKCDYTHCNKSFVKLHELNSHLTSEHKEEGSQKRHLCAKCFLVLKLCDMKHHMKSVHGLTNEEIQRKSTVRKSNQSHFSDMPELRPIAAPKKSVNTNNSTTTTKIAISNVTSLNTTNIKEIAKNSTATTTNNMKNTADDIEVCLPSTSNDSKSNINTRLVEGKIDDVGTSKKNGFPSSSSKILEQETIAKLEHTFWDFQTFSCLPSADQMQQWSRELQIDYNDIAQWFIQKWRTRLVSKKSNNEAEIEMKIYEVEDADDAGEMVLGL